MTGQTHPIAVMDGTCALCAFGAKMIHRLDRSGDIRIAPIQGETGAALMRDHGLDPLDPDSWLFIEEDGTVTRDLDALIRLGQRTGGIGWLLLWFKVFPKPARNWMYARVARNRYAMFGRAEMCDIPNEALKMRLLL
jgi:predicted DCC family thiol-disulfide oxidoreductase YuxK